MTQLKKILFATDLSEPALHAQKYACSLTDQFAAELHVLSVIQDVALVSPDPNVPWVIPASSLEEVQQSLEVTLAQVPDPTWSAGKSIVRVIRTGAPYAEIVAYAKEADIDLVVIGTHGRSGILHALLGSTAEKIVRKSPCPVLTVPPKGRDFV